MRFLNLSGRYKKKIKFNILIVINESYYFFNRVTKPEGYMELSEAYYNKNEGHGPLYIKLSEASKLYNCLIVTNN